MEQWTGSQLYISLLLCCKWMDMIVVVQGSHLHELKKGIYIKFEGYNYTLAITISPVISSDLSTVSVCPPIRTLLTFSIIQTLWITQLITLPMWVDIPQLVLDKWEVKILKFGIAAQHLKWSRDIKHKIFISLEIYYTHWINCLRHLFHTVVYSSSGDDVMWHIPSAWFV